MKVTVSIPLNVTRGEKQPVYLGLFYLKRLRERNIPVRGNIGIEGVEHGVLSMQETETDLVFTWEGEVKTPPVYTDDDEI